MSEDTTAPTPTGSRPRVLVAEDEALIRMDLVELLTEEGYEVIGQAGDGEQALAMAQDVGTLAGVAATVGVLASEVIMVKFPRPTSRSMNGCSML